jgi:hypothetical protein
MGENREPAHKTSPRTPAGWLAGLVWNEERLFCVDFSGAIFSFFWGLTLRK